MVSMTVVGVHSVRVRGRSFVCSGGVLHHSPPLNLHPLQNVVLVEPLHGIGAQHGQVVLQCLVLGGQVLWQGGSRAWEVVGWKRGSRGSRHSVARAMRG